MRRALLYLLPFLWSCSEAAPGPAVSIVSVSPPSLTLGVGASQQLSATARDASLNVVNATATWASSNSAIATVTSDGLLSARAAGSATVTATVSGISGTAQLTVMTGPSSTAVVGMPGFSFTPAQVRIAVGGTVTFQFPSLPHNVIFDPVAGRPTDIQTTANRNVDRVFAVEGTFPYDCTLHPGMSGVIQVVR